MIFYVVPAYRKRLQQNFFFYLCVFLGLYPGISRKIVELAVHYMTVEQGESKIV